MRPRFTAKANTNLGKTSVVTARIPDRIRQEVDEVVASGRPGITTLTDAVQDALGLWLIMEENDVLAEQERADA